MAQYKSRDPQNPYRTGCLVGNYVEDKFGREIAEKGEVSINISPVEKITDLFSDLFEKSMTHINVTYLYLQKPTRTGISENQARFHEGSSLLAYDIPKRTQQDLLEEKDYQDFQQNVAFNQRGLPHYLLTGHGQDLNTFEKRDLATTANQSFGQKKNAKEIIHPMNWQSENTDVSKLHNNGQTTDVPQFGAGMITKDQIKPKGYNEYTKRIDLNYNKIGLRK